MICGIVSPEEGLSGFSNVGTLSVFALLVLSLGLQSTGAVNYLADYVEKLSFKSESGNIFLLSILAGIPSAFLNNTAIVAIMLPVVMRLSKSTGISESKLLMPLSFAAMAGGTITIIGTSTNVIISSIYQDYSGKAFGIFEFAILGFVLFATYLIYILLFGRYLLPNKKSTDITLTEEYELGKFLIHVVINKNSPLVGKTIAESDLDKNRIRTIQIIHKGEEIIWVPEWNEKLNAGDELIVKANYKTLIENKRKLGLRIKKDHLDDKQLTSEDAVLFEAVIGNNSFLLGKMIKDVDFKQLFGAVPLALRRQGASLNQKVSEIEMKFGDTILMEARRQNIDKFHNSKDFIVLGKKKKPNYRTDKLALSIGIIITVVVIVSIGLLPLAVAALAGCVAMYLVGCVSPKYVYRKMEWRIIFLLAGVIPLGIAVQKTGLGTLVATNLLWILGQSSVELVIAILFILTTLFTSFMSNNATAILLAPIAIGIANQMGIDPKPFLITVMFAASTSFLTPIGYQTNTLIYGPGKYRFIDYVIVGGPLTILFALISIFLIPYLF